MIIPGLDALAHQVQSLAYEVEAQQYEAVASARPTAVTAKINKINMFTKYVGPQVWAK